MTFFYFFIWKFFGNVISVLKFYPCLKSFFWRRTTHFFFHFGVSLSSFVVAPWPLSIFLAAFFSELFFLVIFLFFSLNMPHWADSVIELPFPSIRVSVVVRHRVQFFRPFHWPSGHIISSRPLIRPPTPPLPLPPRSRGDLLADQGVISYHIQRSLICYQLKGWSASRARGDLLADQGVICWQIRGWSASRSGGDLLAFSDQEAFKKLLVCSSPLVSNQYAPWSKILTRVLL